MELRSEWVAARPWADRLGVWTSVLCVAHCLLAPVVLSSSVLLARALPGDEPVHRGLALLVAGCGAVALLLGFRRHGRRQVLAMMAAGLACIAGTALFGDRLPSHGCEVAITVLGSALMIAAHRRNHTFCRGCACAGGQARGGSR